MKKNTVKFTQVDNTEAGFYVSQTIRQDDESVRGETKVLIHKPGRKRTGHDGRLAVGL